MGPTEGYIIILQLTGGYISTSHVSFRSRTNTRSCLLRNVISITWTYNSHTIWACLTWMDHNFKAFCFYGRPKISKRIDVENILRLKLKFFRMGRFWKKAFPQRLYGFLCKKFASIRVTSQCLYKFRLPRALVTSQCLFCDKCRRFRCAAFLIYVPAFPLFLIKSVILPFVQSCKSLNSTVQKTF